MGDGRGVPGVQGFSFYFSGVPGGGLNGGADLYKNCCWVGFETSGRGARLVRDTLRDTDDLHSPVPSLLLTS
jgi:hypothetical protein